MTTFECHIVSAKESIFSGAVEVCTVDGIGGQMGILAGHAPLLTALKPGLVHVVDANKEDLVFYANGGIVEVQPNVVTILADSVVRAADIDEAAAEQAKQEALDALLNQKSDLDYALAASQLMESTAQLRTLLKLKK